MKEIFTKSETMSQEYCATFVKLEDIQDIPNAKTVSKALVNGREIVISKNCKVGDIMVYCSNETQLNADFCYMNNLYSDINRNSNCDEVLEWLSQNADATEEEKHDYTIKHRGYFDVNRRIRMIKLAGTYSMGFLIEPEAFTKWCPSLKFTKEDLESLVGTDFDTVNGELFIKAYVPVKQQAQTYNHNRSDRRNKHLKRFDRMIPGQFAFHYDTTPFEKTISRFDPDMKVSISVKLHGTSYIIGNVLVKKPKYGGLYTKVFPYLPSWLQFTKNDYDTIYSSRSVIKNSDINPHKKGFSKGLDACFDKYYELLKDYIPQNITIYGEIVGYCEDTNSYIQSMGKGYDYKCCPGKNQLMIYRVTENLKDGTHREYEVDEVVNFTRNFKHELEKQNSLAAERIIELPILYQGTLRDLYPDLDVNNHWHEEFLERIKYDKEHFGMEELEPLCRNKVPREGIVFRIFNDPVKEAFKLKCVKFLRKEAEDIDNGHVDSEIEERY